MLRSCIGDSRRTRQKSSVFAICTQFLRRKTKRGSYSTSGVPTQMSDFSRTEVLFFVFCFCLQDCQRQRTVARGVFRSCCPSNHCLLSGLDGDCRFLADVLNANLSLKKKKKKKKRGWGGGGVGGGKESVVFVH